MSDALDVWLDGRFAGKLLRGQEMKVEFLYDEKYLVDSATTPLSVSVPKTVAGHGPEAVMPWLSNLLPDAEQVRSRWAAKFGERQTDPFTLLAHMGEDAPGSVQVVPEDVTPAEAGGLSEMSERDIARRVRAILDDPDHWVDDSDDDQSRFSLGGNQGKFALAQIDGAWYEPNGRTASTHIVKPGMVLTSGHTDDHVQAVEFVTMRAARSVGVRAAKVEILDFDGVDAFVTTRFDRRILNSGAVARVHQEDFCQALGVYPALKYEQDGGPTMADMVDLVSHVSSPAYRASDQTALVGLVAFNLLTAGVDAHAKNHSLLHAGTTTRLAPAYDLISAHGLWSEDRVTFKSAAAVKYGKERKYRLLSGRNLVRTADVLGIQRRAFADTLSKMAAVLPDAFTAAIDEVPANMVTEVLVAMPSRIKTFADGFVSSIGRGDLSYRDLPRYEGSHAIGQPAPRIWESGQWRDGRWITGRYRTRTKR